MQRAQLGTAIATTISAPYILRDDHGRPKETRWTKAGKPATATTPAAPRNEHEPEPRPCRQGQTAGSAQQPRRCPPGADGPEAVIANPTNSGGSDFFRPALLLVQERIHHAATRRTCPLPRVPTDMADVTGRG